MRDVPGRQTGKVLVRKIRNERRFLIKEVGQILNVADIDVGQAKIDVLITDLGDEVIELPPGFRAESASLITGRFVSAPAAARDVGEIDVVQGKIDIFTKTDLEN